MMHGLGLNCGAIGDVEITLSMQTVATQTP